MIVMLLSLVTLLGCGEGEPNKTIEDGTKPVKLTIYSGRGESLVGKLFEQLPNDVPFELEVQYGNTAEMVTRLMTEGEQSPADVIFAQDSGHLGVLSKRGLLAELSETTLAQVDPQFRDGQGKWVGTSGRLRVLVYNQDKLPEDRLPRSLKDLADPKWKGKLGWAPTNGSFHAHVSALRHGWGDDETRDWLTAVQANLPTAYSKNAPQVVAAQDGAIELGWVNHYYLHRLNKDGRKAQNWSFPESQDLGNILMVSGVGVRAGSPNKEAAEAFVMWLLSPSVQNYFAQEGFEYPTRPGISTHPDVPPLKPDQLAQVKQDHLADLASTREMLSQLGLL
ncbi:MAG: extracellular solute-binding protein [Myxococcota bacterium]